MVLLTLESLKTPVPLLVRHQIPWKPQLQGAASLPEDWSRESHAPQVRALTRTRPLNLSDDNRRLFYYSRDVPGCDTHWINQQERGVGSHPTDLLLFARLSTAASRLLPPEPIEAHQYAPYTFLHYYEPTRAVVEAKGFVVRSSDDETRTPTSRRATWLVVRGLSVYAADAGGPSAHGAEHR